MKNIPKYTILFGCLISFVFVMSYLSLRKPAPVFHIGEGVIVDYDESNNAIYVNAKPRKTTFERIGGIVNWPCEPTTPAAGYLRLKIYGKWESLYINPRVIDTIKEHEQYTSVIDGSIHAPHTSITTVHNFTYSVEESADYIIDQAKLLWDGFAITEPNQYALGN